MSPGGPEFQGRFARALLSGRLVDDLFIAARGSVLTEVRPGSATDGPLLRGLAVPGLVNAHLHLELSSLAGAVGPGGGLGAWAQRLVATRGARPSEDPEPAGRAAAKALYDSGAALVCDIRNRAPTERWLAEAGVSGVVQHEVLGMARGRGPALLDDVARASSEVRSGAARIVVRACPHAPYSTPAEVLVAAIRAEGRGFPASLHLGEHDDEVRFLDDATGPFAAFLDSFGIDWRWWSPPGERPLAWLDALGVLGPGLLLVHGVVLDPGEARLLAARGVPLVLCPRSNLHIGGALADVPALIAAGAPLALGTDSLASSASLDVLDEIPVLCDAFPEVPRVVWWQLATQGGARALGAFGFGDLTVGSAPGVVHFPEIVDDEGLVARSPHRTWAVPPRWTPGPTPKNTDPDSRTETSP